MITDQHPPAQPLFPSLSSVKSDPAAELTRIKTLIAQAQHELQYAHASNCPFHFVKLAQQILAEAVK